MKNLLYDFKNKIASKEFVYGVFLKTIDPMFSEICGISGFDFSILDLEHGPSDFESLQNNIRASIVRNIVPIVRVPKIDENIIGKALDIGALGVQIPQIKTADDVKNAIKYSKFFPQGERGVCRFVRAANYSDLDRNEYFKTANDTLLILQLEGVEAIQNIDEILAIAGYDILFIGPYDLSQSLGMPGDIKNVKVLNEMINIVEKAKAKGKVVGTFTDDYEMVEKWKSLGVQYISYSTDAGIMLDALKEIKFNIADVNPVRKHMVMDLTLSETLENNGYKLSLYNFKSIVKGLAESCVDLIEVGELGVSESNNILLNSVESISRILPKNVKSNYCLKLNVCNFNNEMIHNFKNNNIQFIRLCFNRKDLQSLNGVFDKIKKQGYKLILSPDDIYSYSTSEIKYLTNLANEYCVYSIIIVDYFGNFKKCELHHLINLIKNKLRSDILIGLYLNDNSGIGISMLAKCLEYYDNNFLILSSVRGINRKHINLKTEVLLTYLNDSFQDSYKLVPVFEIGSNQVNKFFKYRAWDSDFDMYLSAKYGCDYRYIKYLQNKNNLTISSIENIIKMIDFKQSMEFDQKYIEELYVSFLERDETEIDDLDKVKNLIFNKNVFVICPGKSINSYKDKIFELSKNEENVIISVNFKHEYSDYVFVGNNKRMKELFDADIDCIIATSNIPDNNVFAKINYSRLLNDNVFVKDNSGLMLLKLLNLCKVETVTIFGMDGYSYNPDDNYASNELALLNTNEAIDNLNLGMKIVLKELRNDMQIIIV